MLKYILIAVAVLIVVLVIVIAMRPSTFRIVRSITIAAPPAIAFAQVNDLHAWNAWSPWAKIDPAMQQIFEGPPAGVGAVYKWLGNNKVGQGTMTILESRPDDLIRIKLQFLKPFAATNTAEFTFKPQGGQTLVTWAMFGPNNFMGKAFHLFMNVDKMVGGDFEKGLAQMKSVAESATKA